MDKDLFNFIIAPTKDKFLVSRAKIVNSEEYDPYSDDLDILTDLLDNDKFLEASQFESFNLLLSPRAHFYKNYALTQLGNEESKFEEIIAIRILDCILLTGDGTKEAPYVVTRVSDEKDVLSYIGEEFQMQGLIREENKSFDLITTKSGKEIFDITDCLGRMKMSGDFKQLFSKMVNEKKEVEQPTKKWWQFWKN